MNTPATTTAAPRQTIPPAGFQILASRGFPGWLAEQRISLAVSTYQSGKLFLIGTGQGGRLSIVDRNFQRAMGLWSDSQTLWLAASIQLWRMENVLRPGERAENQYDRLFVPRVGYTVGGVDMHDVQVDEDGRVVFVNTRYSCLCTLSERFSFEPLWKPPFISRLAAEDRCHLNGLAVRDGRPRYVTVCGTTDIVDGWRDHRVDGGSVIDVQETCTIAEGFSMPHSPRWYRDQLWLLDSGTGWFGSLDVDTGNFERLTFCPGYARGLSFVGDYAVVGLSKPRREHAFHDLPLEQNLAERRASARCGIFIIHLPTGDMVHWLQIEGVVQELYDVVVLKGVERPKLLGFNNDELRNQHYFEPMSSPVESPARAENAE